MQSLRNPVIIGLQAYGRQSAGTHKRWSSNGPRDIGDKKCGPKRFVRRLKGGVVVYGDAKLPRPERSDSETEDAARKPIPGPQTVDPFARALVAAVDPNARQEARKSLDRRQAVATTSTASSGTPGGKTAGGLTKDKSFGRDNSSGRT